MLIKGGKMNIIKRIFQKKKNGASAIGIIGGADGPTDVFIAGKKYQISLYTFTTVL